MKTLQKSQITGLAAFLIMVVSTFLTYAGIAGMNFNMYGMGKGPKTVAISLIVMALIGATLNYFAKNKTWWLSIIAVIFFGLICFGGILNLKKLQKDEVEIGMAIYGIIAAGVIGVVSSILGVLKK